MGVYIPNAEMPRGCNSCPLVMEIDNTCSLTMGGCTKDERPPHCPLIEIDLVRCGERKKSFDVGGEIFCYNLSLMVRCNFLVKPTDFCSYGERKADERTTE